MNINPTDPIGVFDSGIGGLTVVHALTELLPSENIIYFGDTARVPYGIKSVETIAHYTTQITEYLLQRNVKLLIIACNTMAAVSHQVVEDLSSVPVLNVIEAGSRFASSNSISKRIGVIGTLATISSLAYEQTLRKYDPDIMIFTQACPLFVPFVEEGWLDHPATRLTVEEYLTPLKNREIDTLILGCTHYPLLKPLIQDVIGSNISLVDSAETIAELTSELLSKHNIANTENVEPRYQFFVTDVPLRFQSIGERFLRRPLSNISVVKW